MLTRLILSFLSLFLMLLLSCGPATSETKIENEERKTSPSQLKEEVFQILLDSINLTGTILLFDEGANTYHSNNFDEANTGYLPASTFKIPNTIIALETGVAASPDHLFKWDGGDRWLDAWEHDLTLKEAFAASCVPCYQEVARAVGAERMRAELDRLGYPGMVFDSATVDNFWLGGDSRISPMEQIEFLRRIYHKELPIRPATQRAIRDIMVMEQTDDYTLSGKTGWSINGEDNNGWFVGFVARGDEVYYFATNVSPGPGFEMDGFAAVRVRITRLALANLGVL
ncbi:class D beta-lactamase [Neolewinella persica]|uniref:class D beta-lactamase n=1 Tax=Neolewinella persica TaxID=70998 RepID=UPI0004756A05|nr:class D beta-lactamase [Neolewinella persica]